MFNTGDNSEGECQPVVQRGSSLPGLACGVLGWWLPYRTLECGNMCELDMVHSHCAVGRSFSHLRGEFPSVRHHGGRCLWHRPREGEGSTVSDS